MQGLRCAAALLVLLCSARGLAQEAVKDAPTDYTVTVVGPKRQTETASTSHITARELAAVPLRNAEDVLKLVPGLTLVQHGSEGKGHQFFLRGFDAIHGADLELSVDGIPVNEWSNIHGQGYIDLGFLIPEAISAVDVTKGPYTLSQGAFAMAGSASYQLGIAKPMRGLRSSYAIGTTHRHRGVVTYTPREGDGRDFIAAEVLRDKGFGQRRAIDRASLLGRVQWFDSPRRGALSLLSAANVARFELPGALRNEDVEAGRIGFYDSYERAMHGLSARALLALKYAWQNRDHEVKTSLWAGYRRLELLENYTGFLADPVGGDRRRQKQYTWNVGAELSYDLRLTEQVSLEAGAAARGDLLDQHQHRVDASGDVVARERSLEGVQTLSHLRLGFRFRPLDTLTLTAGARLDVAQVSVRDGLDDARKGQAARAVASPRVTAEWRARAALRLFAAYGRGFRPPEARAFTSYRPERTGITENLHRGGSARMTVADSIEVGLRLLPHRVFAAQLSGFGAFIERESVFDHVSGMNLELNRTRRLGCELALQVHPLPWLSLHADATYVRAKFVASGNPIPFAPWLTGGVRAVVTHPSGLHAGLRFLGVAPRDLPHGARGATLAMLDATAGYRFHGYALDLELENVLNRQLREGEYHYASDFRTGTTSSLPAVHYVAGPPFNARLSLSAVF